MAEGINWGNTSFDQAIKIRNDDLGNIIIREDNSKQIAEAIEKQLAVALEKVGLHAEANAKIKLTENRSVQTGRLRNSITHVLDVPKKEVYIGTNVEYAPYVELGTSRSKAKPYLKPAANDYTDEYRALIEDALKNA